MKILEKGRAQTGWAKELYCTGEGNGGGGCCALLLVEQGDLFRTAHTDYGGDREVYTTYRCPQCRVLTDIPNSGVPAEIRRNLTPEKGTD